jgi:Tol biopolymer transport system component/predicted Ser/Thr protein kinase
MTIQIGKRLGPYEITAPLGAGGMGEVYRARDTRLERTVAIKVLPMHFADRPDLRERFEREARTIASLNHAHICMLYDIGHQDGTDYLVMEYLDGETLAARLLKGPLPIDQVLQYAIEIADALDKAHRQGITHRDLKPRNIQLTKSGAKLLDFGLAKLRQAAEPAQSFSKRTTAETDITAEGTIVGTLQYMAPEQLEGTETDGRADIFAFGVVVYEMATGKKAFEGKSQASLIAKILASDPPPISSLQPMTPPALDRVVKRCLAKDRDDRWQSANDLTQVLKLIVEGGSQISSLPIAPVRGILSGGRQRALILGLGGLILGAAIASFAVRNLRPAPAPAALPVTRTVINLPPGQQLAGLENGPALALSPDGARLAYVARQGSTQQLYLRVMDSLDSKAIPGTEGAVSPFFSPDGQSLGFFAGGKLMRVSISGGPTLTIGDALNPRGASWGSQGKIAFGLAINSALLQVPDVGGTPQPLTRLEKGEPGHRWPEFLPGGKAVLFAAGANPLNFTNAQVAVQSVGASERRNLTLGMYPRYARSGHLVYAQGGNLMAVPFDLERLALTGPAVTVVDGVRQSPIDGDAQYSFSGTGTLIYASGGLQDPRRKVVWVDRKGAEQVVTAPAHAYRSPRLSPDGRRIAVTIEESEDNIWLYDLTRETLTRLTLQGDLNLLGAWAPDGKRIAFQSNQEGTPNVFWQLADGSGGPERLTTSEYRRSPNSWSPDGQLLAFIEVNPTTGYDIWVLRLSDRKAQPFLRTQFNEGAPRFSPDGHWLAYISDESGRYEIYVQPYPGPGGKWQISTEGGTEPVWNPNGRELFYRSGDKMMAVEIATQHGFTAGKPWMLFQDEYVPTPATFPNYDVAPDGRRFLMLKPTEQTQSAPTQINVVLNWFEELKRRVPAGK